MSFLETNGESHPTQFKVGSKVFSAGVVTCLRLPVDLHWQLHSHGRVGGSKDGLKLMVQVRGGADIEATISETARDLPISPAPRTDKPDVNVAQLQEPEVLSPSIVRGPKLAREDGSPTHY